MGDTVNRQALSIGVPATGYAPNTSASFQKPFVPTLAPPKLPPIVPIQPHLKSPFGMGGIGGGGGDIGFRGRPYGGFGATVRTL